MQIKFDYKEFLDDLDDKKQRARNTLNQMERGLLTYEEFCLSIIRDYDNYTFMKYYTNFNL